MIVRVGLALRDKAQLCILWKIDLRKNLKGYGKGGAATAWKALKLLQVIKLVRIFLVERFVLSSEKLYKNLT